MFLDLGSEIQQKIMGSKFALLMHQSAIKKNYLIIADVKTKGIKWYIVCSCFNRLKKLNFF